MTRWFKYSSAIMMFPTRFASQPGCLAFFTYALGKMWWRFLLEAFRSQLLLTLVRPLLLRFRGPWLARRQMSALEKESLMAKGRLAMSSGVTRKSSVYAGRCPRAIWSILGRSPAILMATPEVKRFPRLARKK